MTILEICGTVRERQGKSFNNVLLRIIYMSNNRALPFELWDFIKERKVWWLAPILLMLIIVGALIMFGQSSALSPFVYALF